MIKRYKQNETDTLARNLKNDILKTYLYRCFSICDLSSGCFVTKNKCGK